MQAVQLSVTTEDAPTKGSTKLKKQPTGHLFKSSSDLSKPASLHPGYHQSLKETANHWLLSYPPLRQTTNYQPSWSGSYPPLRQTTNCQSSWSESNPPLKETTNCQSSWSGSYPPLKETTNYQPSWSRSYPPLKEAANQWPLLRVLHSLQVLHAKM